MLFAGFSAGFSAGALQAQTPDPADAGIDPGRLMERWEELQREYDWRREVWRLPGPPMDPLQLDELELPRLPDAGPEFLLQGIVFSESGFLDDEELERLAGEFVGRVITFGDLQGLVDRINAWYEQLGIITARAFVPPQELDDGVVLIQLVEGRVGRIRFEGNTYVAEDYLRRQVPYEGGELLDPRELRSRIGRFNDFSSINLQAGLEPGEEPGLSDITMRVDEPPRWVTSTFTDNAGSENTGEWRAGVSGVYRGLSARDDSANLTVTRSKGSTSAAAGYSIPLTPSGGTLRTDLMSSRIEIIDGPFRELDLEGESFSAQLGWNQPFMRTWRDLLQGTFSVRTTESSSDIAGAELSDWELLKVTAGTQWTRRGMRSQLSVSGDLSWLDTENNITGETDDFGMLGLESSLVYRVGDFWLASATLRGQAVDRRVIASPEQFQLGGASTVRGYREGLLSGARGYLARASLRWQAMESLSPELFIDHGGIEAVSPESESITGVGLGVRYQWRQSLSLDVSAGYAADEITPDQDRYFVHGHLSYSWASQ